MKKTVTIILMVLSATMVGAQDLTHYKRVIKELSSARCLASSSRTRRAMPSSTTTPFSTRIRPSASTATNPYSVWYATS